MEKINKCEARNLLKPKGEKMEYLLTQEEMDALTPIKKLQERDVALEWAKQLILKLVNFKCGSYCDRCPIASINDTEADRPTYTTSKLICPFDRHYSK